MSHRFASPKAVALLLGAGAALSLAACNSSSTPVPPTPPPSTNAMYITDTTNNSISVYGQNANCNCGPARLIQGAKTGLSSPVGIAVDSTGVAYVANLGSNLVSVFAAGANQNVSPIFTISGLNSPFGVAVDGAKNVYVTNSGAGGGTQSIEVFRQSSTSAFLTIGGAATGLSTPGFLTLDAAGNIWVANQSGNSVEEFPNIGSNPGGNVTPSAVISGAATQIQDPQGIAFDSAGRLYVAINNPTGFFDGVLVFTPPLNGNITPINEICGPATGVNNPTGVAVNSLGTVFAVNSQTNVAGYVTAFAANNIGNLACTGPLPSASVGGNHTPFLNPTGIALH